MATLERLRPFSKRPSTASATTEQFQLDTNVPAPFPRDKIAQELLNELAAEALDLAPEHELQKLEPSTSDTPPTLTLHVSQGDATREFGPSLTQVEQSCLMTLNNLLSQDTIEWQAIVPSRRHSMPAQSPTTSSTSFQALLTKLPTSSSALYTLVQNLRNHYDSQSQPLEVTDDASLLRELELRVTSLIENHIISSADAPLAQSLVSLLTHLSRTSAITPDAPNRPPLDSSHSSTSTNIYDTLRRQVFELQTKRDAHTLLDSSSEPPRPPIEAVQHAILWHKIDDDLDEVLRLCKERAEFVPRPQSPDAASLPPEYDPADYEPPTYDPAEYSESSSVKVTAKSGKAALSTPAAPSLDEKMRLDLDAITMAIDRLYMVAPQLSNQRVELKRSKLEQMAQASASGSNATAEGWRAAASRHKGKAKEILGVKSDKGDMEELENMLELINKASTRRIEGQSVVVDGQRMAERVEKARIRDLEKRDAFHEKLVTHSQTRRLTSQDAELRRSPSNASLEARLKNPNALLTLPEFIRESIPNTLEQAQDPDAMLTLPEFVRELHRPPTPPPIEVPELPPLATTTSKFIRPFKSRSRSLSAPARSFAWLIPGATSTSRSPSPLSGDNADGSIRPRVNGRTSPKKAGLDVQYVAEHHDHLGNVAVFLQVNGTEAGAIIETEVFPSGGERLFVKCGASTSQPLALPARVVPGKMDVKVQSGHFEATIACTTVQPNGHTPAPPYSGDSPGTGLLDATQLKALDPTTFICASCSLPLVHASRLSRYDDLPSEHWAELLEAWMCHADQRITERVALYANGLWPAPGQALVGGSYILFESSSLVESNIRNSDHDTEEYRDDWQPVRCICGAAIGRCSQQISSNNTLSRTYRLAKYAIRPVSPSSEPLKIPLSAFILQDMDELVQAHATYRFVLLDEEEEKPRILIWMFKSHMQISYATSNYKLMSRSASVQAAKVNFKILGPSVSPTVKSTVEKYPGFKQHERLLYPMDVCRRLAGLLKESNVAYPQGRRIMGGLDVGWLLRS
ncbi:HECT-like ubiquitin-conjugating enzyme-binding-domain-containing protein [Hysterangium stoloniferum]|nr:HECT-like ubiquitin-conjugating enzyme-binding-domain-containing protein [Hysterangium stoloniferum]